MAEPSGPVNSKWASAAFMAGLLYAIIGLVSAALAGGVWGPRLRFWRFMAWVLSAIVFGVHIARDRLRLRYSATSTALHAALGAALGALALAISATIHGYAASSPHLRAVKLSLVIWPIATAVPAFLVALLVAFVLKREPEVKT